MLLQWCAIAVFAIFTTSAIQLGGVVGWGYVAIMVIGYVMVTGTIARKFSQ